MESSFFRRRWHLSQRKIKARCAHHQNGRLDAPFVHVFLLLPAFVSDGFVPCGAVSRSPPLPLRPRQLRASNEGKKIWEKTEYSSTLTRTRRMIADLIPEVDPTVLSKARESKGLVAAATAAISGDRYRERESMVDFIAKKREIYLVQVGVGGAREGRMLVEDNDSLLAL